MARCRDCTLYDLDAVRSKSGSVLSHKVGRCLWVSTETWPASVALSMNSRPRPNYMQPNDGDRCQRFIKRATPTPSPKEPT